MRLLKSLLIGGIAATSLTENDVGEMVDLKCHVCSHTRNHEGLSDGKMGDSRCWEAPESTGPAVTCHGGEICYTDLRISWGPYGKQLETISRGCARPRQNECHENVSDHTRSKQCRHYCNTDVGCNDGLEIQEEFHSTQDIQSCITCSFNDETGEGNSNCVENYDQIVPSKCPAHANAGCFTTTTNHLHDGKDCLTVTRGCATFDLRHEDCYLTAPSNNPDDTTAVCKDVCNSDNCNKDPVTAPDVNATYAKCSVCTETRNDMGKTIGVSYAGCFEGDGDFEATCSSTNDVCVSETMVDWQPRGYHIFQMIRRCGSPEEESGCNGFNSASINFKDCKHICDGDNCNNDNTELDKLQSAGNVDKCHTCTKTVSDDGSTINGNKQCGTAFDEQEADGKYGLMDCPPYADAACFNALSFHRYDDIEYEDDYRGCTPFDFGDDTTTEFKEENCYSTIIDGLEHLNCKETCKGADGCNDLKHSVKKQCFSCRATRDGTGAFIGASDDRCFDEVEADMLHDCAGEENECYSEMSIDWLANGHYLHVIERGCRAKPEYPTANPCYSSSSSLGNFVFKDCIHTCDEPVCNNGMEVGLLFTNPDQTKPLKCQACSFYEYDDGSREGLPACLFQERPDREVECPVYANHGCYISTNSHINPDGENKREVERGCAAFGEPAGIPVGTDCYDSTVVLPDADDVNFAVCKEFCKGNNCNNKMPKLPNESDSSWPACVQCEVIYNAEGNIIGTGNGLDCRGEFESHNNHDHVNMTDEATSRLTQRCPNKGDICVTDMQVDWFAKGELQYRITRGCSSFPAATNCYEGSSSLLQYRDCQSDCDPTKVGNSCNNHLEDISRRMTEERNVYHCITCSYQQFQNGTVDGFEECTLSDPNVHPPLLDKLARKCPPYARASCATATSWHMSYVNELVEIEEDFRHCSPFTRFPETECNENSIQGLDHLNCKKTCTSEACNTDKIARGTQCYQCQATRGFEGRGVGLGDQRCWDEIDDSMLINCQKEYVCGTEMMADWTRNGVMWYTITRGCMPPKQEEACYSGPQDAAFKWRDCLLPCEGNACNGDNEIYEKISPNKEVSKCNVCLYEELENGGVNGNKNCDGGVPDGADDNDCPAYADAACFASAAIHTDFGEVFRQIYKGCSTFNIDNDEEYFTDIGDGAGHTAAYSVTKTTCQDDNCNTDHIEPPMPNDQYATMCQVCSVTVDQNNNTIGTGQSDCWDESTKYQQDCGQGQYCATDLEIDWIAKGAHTYKLIRGCTDLPPPMVEAEPCSTGSSPMVQYKDCKVACNPRVEGNSCNNNLIDVSMRFASDRPVSSCFACEYFETPDGSIQGNKNCRTNQNLGPNKVHQCPMYANSACFTAHSYHTDYTQDPLTGDQFTEDYRGCSPFTDHYGNVGPGRHCEQIDFNGFAHENCKELCFFPRCNFAYNSQRRQCYQCSVTYDSEGNVLGSGDADCMRTMDPALDGLKMKQCSSSEHYCVDLMEIDWYARGKQVVHFQRGCAKQPGPDECVEFGDYTSVKSRLCTQSCSADLEDEEGTVGSPCNSGLEIHQKFAPEGPQQDKCVACSYIENDDGTISGNRNCQRDPPLSLETDCPIYQSSGCYSASSIHEILDGNNEFIQKYETAKGCSYFRTLGDELEQVDQIIGNVPYQTFKQTCTGTNCNRHL